MRCLVACLLLLGLARAQAARSIDEILDDHARALGEAGRVGTLRARAGLGADRIVVRGAVFAWRAPGEWVRTIPTGPTEPAWIEYFVGGRACFTKGAFARFRPEQETTRGGYYFYRLQAEPFPLQTFVSDLGARRGLRKGAVEGYEVLYTPRDEQGVRVAYLLDPKTHLLSEVQVVEEDDEPIVRVTYDDYRAVGGVQLPHRIYARYLLRNEEPERNAIEALAPRVWQQEVEAWEVDPELDERGFVLPGLGRGGAEGFERVVIPTGPDPYDVGVADLDGDGASDVAVACWGGLWVHFGGAEERPVRVPLGKGHHGGLAIEDFDLDGRLEVITTSRVQPDRRYLLVRFDAQRAPSIREVYGAPHGTHALATPDLDLDGIPDLVATGTWGRNLDVKFGNGAGFVRLRGLVRPLDAAGKGRVGYGLSVGNLDGNPMRDIAVADGTRVVVFVGEANLSFQPRVAVPPDDRPGWRAVDVAFVDLDLDGRDDLLVSRAHPVLDLPGDVLVVRNRDGKLKATEPVEAGSQVWSIAAGYFDGDRFPDAAATSFLTGEVALLYGDGKGGLSKPEHLRSGRGASRLVVADLDGDGRDDLAVSNRIDDTITLLRNRREAHRPRREAEPRARACPPPTRVAWRLEGLSDPYEFAGEFRLPPEIRDPSGIAVLGGVVNSQFVIVSDKRSALFRAVLDRSGERLLVGPPIPLLGLETERLDLEEAAFDHASGSLFLACEADSTVIRASLWGHVLGRAPTGIVSGGNDGIEALGLRRKKDGTPLLYVFKERNGTTGTQPIVRLFDLAEEPFALRQRGEDLKLPLAVPDQTGACVVGQRLFFVSRLLRGVAEVDFDADGFAQQAAGVASFMELVEKRLGLSTRYGVAEGVAVDPRGDLFLLVDNNGETLGVEGLNRGAEGRLLWFRNLGEPGTRPPPERVVVQHILIPWSKAEGAGADVELDREEAARIARETFERLRRGEDFERIAEERHYARAPFPTLLRVAGDGIPARKGEFPRSALPVALARLALALEPGEVGLCEYHELESPYGWHVLRRVE